MTRILKKIIKNHSIYKTALFSSVVPNYQIKMKKFINKRYGVKLREIKDYIAKNENAYKYLEESISNFPDQKTLSLKLNELGFDNTSITNLFNGIVSIHKSFKIS